jgi:phosphoribosylaminoimidazolecarboxamide formyltransferase/IMP cyclohydrolase
LQPVIQKSLLNGILLQETDQGNYLNWNECGAMPAGEKEKQDLLFANLLCKHLKSNAIALVQGLQLIGKGCGQTSRIDALRQALAKAEQFQFRVSGAVMASDAFFPFDDCVKLAHQAGIGAFIQPGGSIRDEDSIRYCRDNELVMVMTGLRHFKH